MVYSKTRASAKGRKPKTSAVAMVNKAQATDMADHPAKKKAKIAVKSVIVQDEQQPSTSGVGAAVPKLAKGRKQSRIPVLAVRKGPVTPSARRSTKKVDNEQQTTKEQEETAYERLYRKVQENHRMRGESTVLEKQPEQQVDDDLDQLTSQGHETLVDLNDGDRVLRLAVDPNDSLYQEGTEPETESEGSDALSTDEDEEVVLKTPVFEEVLSQPEAQLNPIQEIVSQQDEIAEIDEKMMGKIEQLHKQMTKQGMHKAANLLQGCFSPETEPPPVGRRVRIIANNPKGILRNEVGQGNFNQNRNMTSGSVETIYENAVEKHCSSSSEENFNLSGETIERESDLFLGERRSRKRSRDAMETLVLPSTSADLPPVEPTPEEQA